MKHAELIAHAKKAIQGSEAEVARRLDITAQSLNQFKNGKVPMPDRITVKLAKLAGLDCAAALAEIEAEQAKGDEETRNAWKEIARRASAAALVILVLLAGIMPATTQVAGRLRNLAHYFLPRRNRLFHN